MGPSWIVEHEAGSANWCPEEQLESRENCQGAWGGEATGFTEERT